MNNNGPPQFRCEGCGALLTAYQTALHLCPKPPKRRIVFLGHAMPPLPNSQLRALRRAGQDCLAQRYAPIAPALALEGLAPPDHPSWTECAGALLGLADEVWALPGWPREQLRLAHILGKLVTEYQE